MDGCIHQIPRLLRVQIRSSAFSGTSFAFTPNPHGDISPFCGVLFTCTIFLWLLWMVPETKTRSIIYETCYVRYGERDGFVHIVCNNTKTFRIVTSLTQTIHVFSRSVRYAMSRILCEKWYASHGFGSHIVISPNPNYGYLAAILPLPC